ncbi:hypothetical protein HMSSN139_10440 [Paenibacillus sp. HMSSN-139]|nr:hypothetical protein HMSSN139_10440 [Paenibacillus sp. HMSSN-139]
MGIMVIGSFMMDLVIGANRAPEGGETIIGNSFDRFPGGKGANQAVAAARLGASVAMAGKLGNDPFGEEMRAVLEQGGDRCRPYPDRCACAYRRRFNRIGRQRTKPHYRRPRSEPSVYAGGDSGAGAAHSKTRKCS